MKDHWKSIAAFLAPISAVVAVLTFAWKPVTFLWNLDKRIAEAEARIIADNRLRDEQLAAIQNILIPLVLQSPYVLGERYVSEAVPEAEPSGFAREHLEYLSTDEMVATAAAPAWDVPVTSGTLHIAWNPGDYAIIGPDGSLATPTPTPTLDSVYDALKIPNAQRAIP